MIGIRFNIFCFLVIGFCFLFIPMQAQAVEESAGADEDFSMLASSYKLTVIDKKIIALREIAVAGNKAEFDSKLAALEKQNVPEALYKLGHFFEQMPPDSLVYKASPEKAVAYYKQSLAVAKTKKINNEWVDRTRYSLALSNLYGRGVSRNIERAEALLKEAISGGYAPAILRFAKILEKGEGLSPANPEKAAYWYRSALRNDSGEAALALASLLQRKMLLNSSKEAALEMRSLGISMLEDAVATKSDGRAALRLGRLYERGEGLDPDFSKALTWYEKSIQLGVREGYRYAGRLYGEGVGASEQDKEKATKYLIEAAESGSAPAAIQIAEALFSSADSSYINVTQEKALKWLERAAKSGNKRALNMLAEWHLLRENIGQAIIWLAAAAEKGNISAMLKLHALYLDPSHAYVDEGKALEYFEKASVLIQANGNSSERLKMARLYLQPQEIVYNVQKGKELTLALADSGNVTAMVFMAENYEFGNYGEVDYKGGFHWYSRASALGDVGGKIELARYFREGLGVEKNSNRADQLMQEALDSAEGGEDESMTEVGRAFKMGSGVDKDKEAAFDWFIQAARSGHMGAKMEIARMVKWGIVPSFKASESIAMFEQAAVSGSVDAMLELGRAYSSGHNIRLDAERGLRYYLKAYEAGKLEGGRLAAQAYLSGRGASLDVDKGLELLKEVANAGDNAAMLDLANFYHFSNENNDNWQGESLSWLKRSGNAGNVEALYQLGMAYLKGNGVPKDISLAKTYLKQAETGEFSLAQSQLKKMKMEASSKILPSVENQDTDVTSTVPVSAIEADDKQDVEDKIATEDIVENNVESKSTNTEIDNEQ